MHLCIRYEREHVERHEMSSLQTECGMNYMIMVLALVISGLYIHIVMALRVLAYFRVTAMYGNISFLSFVSAATRRLRGVSGAV